MACRKKYVNIVELLLGKFNANINITNEVGCGYLPPVSEEISEASRAKVSCRQTIEEFVLEGHCAGTLPKDRGQLIIVHIKLIFRV